MVHFLLVDRGKGLIVYQTTYIEVTIDIKNRADALQFYWVG